jgi:hypothetical protein
MQSTLWDKRPLCTSTKFGNAPFEVREKTRHFDEWGSYDA